VPLQNLEKFTVTLLLIVLLIGAVILIVLNIFNVRERKYEIGVYTAIGIKKPKVVAQFAAELLIVTLFAVIIGTGIGTVAAVPVGDAMLSNQVQAVQSSQQDQQNQLGRGRMAPPDGNSSGPGNARVNRNLAPGMITRGGQVDYISQINASLDLVVILELISIGLLLSIISTIGGAVSVMRYEPLQILADRS
jgi:putative ABC transport system permease protein